MKTILKGVCIVLHLVEGIYFCILVKMPIMFIFCFIGLVLAICEIIEDNLFGAYLALLWPLMIPLGLLTDGAVFYSPSTKSDHELRTDMITRSDTVKDLARTELIRRGK